MLTSPLRRPHKPPASSARSAATSMGMAPSLIDGSLSLEQPFGAADMPWVKVPKSSVFMTTSPLQSRLPWDQQIAGGSWLIRPSTAAKPLDRFAASAAAEAAKENITPKGEASAVKPERALGADFSSG